MALRPLAAFAAIIAIIACTNVLHAQRGNQSEVSPQLTDPEYLSFASFNIPFNVEPNADIRNVQLWVSTDSGQTWQMHGAVSPSKRQFDFRAAAEGLYYFSVQTISSGGQASPSKNPPLRVIVDTSKPETAIRADINDVGQLVVDVRVLDDYLNLESTALRMRTDRDPNWQVVPLGKLNPVDDMFEGQAVINLPSCREVALIFSAADKAGNSGEASYVYTMPRTAAGDSEMTLASSSDSITQSTQASSTGNNANLPRNNVDQSIPQIPGAIAWRPAGQAATTAVPLGTQSTGSPAGPGQLVAGGASQGLSLNGNQTAQVEELPVPVGQPVETSGTDTQQNRPSADPAEPVDRSSFSSAYHCRSRTFNLDYSVDVLRGSSLVDVELWGTEDGGRSWQMWGSDPDRTSPFDVQVGNEGLFGFRMVIVGENQLVSNRPKDGDSAADIWINVDTELPTAKITRAVYGEGPEDGMLVIDYTCQDSHLVDRPITLSYSEQIDGPWTPIVTGSKNTGIYLWKADPNMPGRIYLQLEVVDKAGNVGSHKLDLPIDTKGLAPRGRIQGFRPILEPAS